MRNMILERGSLEYIQDGLPSIENLLLYSGKWANDKLNYINSAGISFDNNIPFAFREYKLTHSPSDFYLFDWKQPALFLTIFIALLYTAFSSFNTLQSPTIYKKTDFSAEVLLLVWH